MRSRAAVLLVAAFLSGCGPSPASLPVVTLELRQGTARKTVEAEVAATAGARLTGLMHRESVPDGTGMLFAYPGEGSWGGIWMKNTLVPLDVAFILRGEVLEIHTLQPCRTESCPTTSPAGPYDQVLEVPAGWFARTGLGEGARVTRS